MFRQSGFEDDHDFRARRVEKAQEKQSHERTERRLGRVLLALSVLLFLSTPHSRADSAMRQAAVAIPEKQAAAIAVATLNRGGNAVDAAVAVGFALAVTLPDAGNIGGGGFMTLYMGGAGEFLDYRETAPAAASRDMYLDQDGKPTSDASVFGHLAVGTPGTVAGLRAAHERYGKLSWESLLQPAIELARDGFVPELWFLDVIRDAPAAFASRTNFSEYFAKANGTELFRQTELAKTLQRIAKTGGADFYHGKTADLLVQEMRRGGGLITSEDLKSYRPIWRTPMRETWRRYEILTAPLPSSGGFAIVQYLRMRDLIGKRFLDETHNSAQYIHLKAELEKRIFADRAQYLGDPDFSDFDVQQLLTDEYMLQRVSDLSFDKPSPTSKVKAGLEGKHTTHFSILDFEGNAVSNTYTLNTDFGSGVVVEGAGFLLNNEMDDFSIAPGVPNYYGVVGDEANAIAPGKRMLSSMSPTILLRDGKPSLVVGAMGGSTIFTTVYQMISNLTDFRMSAKQAQEMTRVHHQLLPENLISYSPSTPLADTTANQLRERGYRVEPHPWEFGNVQLVWRNESGALEAESDPRFAGRAQVLPEPETR
ncbi:MAG: gamma-glutamyltransferase [Pseudomonadota bacterium]